MRNRGLHDKLHAFVCAASERLALLIDSGAEIPYEVAESPGARSVLYRYKPLSDAFVRNRFPELLLRVLPSFPEVLAALSRIEGVSGYLRVMGTSYVPAAGNVTARRQRWNVSSKESGKRQPPSSSRASASSVPTASSSP